MALTDIRKYIETEHASISIECDDGETVWMDISSKVNRLEGCGIQFDASHLTELIAALTEAHVAIAQQTEL